MSAGGLADRDTSNQLTRQGDMVVRLGSAAVLLGIALAAAYFGGVVAGIVLSIFAAAILYEWTTITGGVARWLPFAVAVAAAIVVASFGMLLEAIAIAVAAAVTAGALSRDGWLPAGIIYAAIFGICLIALREAPEYGVEALIFVLAIVWVTDSGAFFAGRLIGGPKLWPRISPKKTWAGAVGGLVSGVLAGVAVIVFFGLPIAPLLIAVAVGLSVCCQLGDLFESWVKRKFGAKDSGHIIPGHGGILDRVDGLTFAAAAALLIGVGHSGSGDFGRGLLLW